MHLLIFTRIMLLFFLLVSMTVGAEEKIKMEGMSVIGNKESPNLLYIVPWKSPKIPDVEELVISSKLFDEALMPVDREIFIRKELYRRSKIDIYNIR